MVRGPGTAGCEEQDVKMEISNEKVLEDILIRIQDKKGRADLAKNIEKGFITLYNNLNPKENLEKGMKIYFDDSSGQITIKEDKKGNRTYIITHKKSELEGNWTDQGSKTYIMIQPNKIKIKEYGYTFFGKRGNLEKLLKFYSKQTEYEKNAARRIKSLITIPGMVLKATKQKAKEEQKGGGVDALFQLSNKELFDIEVLKNTYYSNPKTFKQLFDLATDEQKKKVIQELIKTKEANKEVDTWIEENHEKLATTASRDHIYTK